MNAPVSSSRCSLVDLPDLCLHVIARNLATLDEQTERPHLSQRFPYPLRDVNDIARDVVVLAATDRTIGINLARTIAYELDPPGVSSEDLIDSVLVGEDESCAATASARPGTSVARLKEVCKTLGLKVSGNKKELVSRVDVVRKRVSRDRRTHLCRHRLRASKAAYSAFTRLPVRDVKFAYALEGEDDPSIGIGAGREVSRATVYAAAVKKYTDAPTLRDTLRVRDNVRLATRDARRDELRRALHSRKPWLTVRNDSAMCAQYIEGHFDSPSLEHVVDVTEEMHFLYERTNYPTILRTLRSMDREGDRDFGDRSYWRKRDMVRDGLIEYMDEDTPECSDDDDDEEEYTEAQRREIAKQRAVNEWLKKRNVDRSLLPRRLMTCTARV